MHVHANLQSSRHGLPGGCGQPGAQSLCGEINIVTHQPQRVKQGEEINKIMALVEIVCLLPLQSLSFLLYTISPLHAPKAMKFDYVNEHIMEAGDYILSATPKMLCH